MRLSSTEKEGAANSIESKFTPRAVNVEFRNLLVSGRVGGKNQPARHVIQ